MNASWLIIWLAGMAGLLGFGAAATASDERIDRLRELLISYGSFNALALGSICCKRSALKGVTP